MKKLWSEYIYCCKGKIKFWPIQILILKIYINDIILGYLGSKKNENRLNFTLEENLNNLDSGLFSPEFSSSLTLSAFLSLFSFLSFELSLHLTLFLSISFAAPLFILKVFGLFSFMHHTCTHTHTIPSSLFLMCPTHMYNIYALHLYTHGSYLFFLL